MEPNVAESVSSASDIDQIQVNPGEAIGHNPNGHNIECAPDSRPSAWYDDSKYKRYWQHHRQVMQWFQKHKVMRATCSIPEPTANLSSACMSPTTEQWKACGEWLHYMSQISMGLYQYWTYLYNPYSEPGVLRTWDSLYPYSAGVQSNVPFSIGRGHSRGRGRGHGARRSLGRIHQPNGRIHNSIHRNMMEGSEVDADSERTSKTEDMETDTCSFQMEITEDMRDFFAQSARHRKQRDAIKRENEENGEEHVEIVEVSANKNRASGLAPSVRPGSRRTAEMKLLYGKGAAMIHGMETAMQLTYDRNCDLKQPKLWPNMPLNVKFDY